MNRAADRHPDDAAVALPTVASDGLSAWRSKPGASGGASLIDVLAGLAIGLVVLVIVHQTFVAFESVRRNAQGAADAQSSGMFALATLASHIGNAGFGIAAAANALESCPAADIATTLRPIAVLITDGGSPDRPDSIVVRQSLSASPAMPAAFAIAAPAGSSFRVESPDAFQAGDRIAATSRAGACATAQVTSVAGPVAGVVDIAHSAVAADFPLGSVLLNLGPAGLAVATRYDVVSNALRSADISNGDAPVPLASNLVNLKLQYGVDSDGDGTLDTWASAVTGGTWSPATLLGAPRSTLARIKAVRIGIVVRSAEPDRALTGAHHWVLFDCDAADKSACPGRLEGTIPGSPAGGYRYRSYEAIVPLRNVIWNRDA